MNKCMFNVGVRMQLGGLISYCFVFRPATFHISEHDLDSCIPPMLSALRFPFMVSIQNIPSSIHDLNSIAVGFSPESPVKFSVISGILF